LVQFHLMKNLSRRDFLKLGGLAMSSMAFSVVLPDFTDFEDIDLVRVATTSVSVYKEPVDTSAIVATWPRDALVNVYETIDSGTPSYNPIWYRVFGGYMHRARLQKVRYHSNLPLATIPATKSLAEVTFPYAEPYRFSELTGWTPVPFRLYYSTIHWITDIDSGPDGKAWYRIQDEADKNVYYYVPARQMRPISPSELDPITPEVENKRIEVNLTEQSLSCYESSVEVYHCRISSGVQYAFDTPAGNHNILVKLPSRRMSAADRAASDDQNVLAGVPWCCFFTTEGHAFHGTYWHDDFGIPHSHGCVNMQNEDARWLFRWSRPPASFDEIDKATLDRKGFGTAVEIHY
jgi:lipoprotein-anchoring transpeptidase ErfK/SrfK